MSDDFVILLAEDEPNDVELVQLALKSVGINRVQVVRDGEEVVDYLAAKKKYANRSQNPFPALALLDIKMPKMTGLEVLEWLRGRHNPRLRRLPVIIMSSSSEQKDIDRAYELGVNAYLVKPHAFSELVDVLKATTDFWRDIAAHPRV